jgi:hypothetical protein
MERVLIFCTSYVRHAAEWHVRYRRWIDYHARVFGDISAQGKEPIFAMIDDASPTLPSLRQLSGLVVHTPATLAAGNAVSLGALNILTFDTHLGRSAVDCFPGWFRSFTAAAGLAKAAGATRIIHIESDSYVLTRRARDYLLAAATGWTALWCPKYRFAETCLQAITLDQFSVLDALAQADYEKDWAGKYVEMHFPFTHTEQGLVGDRYGEDVEHAPPQADYAAQVGTRLRFQSEFF